MISACDLSTLSLARPSGLGFIGPAGRTIPTRGLQTQYVTLVKISKCKSAGKRKWKSTPKFHPRPNTPQHPPSHMSGVYVHLGDVREKAARHCENGHSRRTQETGQDTMKSRRRASPGEALATFISLALRFLKIRVCVCIYSRFFRLKKSHMLLLQSEKDTFVQERKNTAKRQITVEKYLPYI